MTPEQAAERIVPILSWTGYVDSAAMDAGQQQRAEDVADAAAIIRQALAAATAEVRAELERVKRENENLRVVHGARTITLAKMVDGTTDLVKRAESAEASRDEANARAERAISVLERVTPHVPSELLAKYVREAAQAAAGGAREQTA